MAKTDKQKRDKARKDRNRVLQVEVDRLRSDADVLDAGIERKEADIARLTQEVETDRTDAEQKRAAAQAIEDTLLQPEGDVVVPPVVDEPVRS